MIFLIYNFKTQENFNIKQLHEVNSEKYDIKNISNGIKISQVYFNTAKEINLVTKT